MKSFIFQNENGLREKEEKGRIYIYIRYDYQGRFQRMRLVG